MRPACLVLSAVANVFACVQGMAQTSHDHGAHLRMGSEASPTLPGDDTFGAVAEIVALLTSDPATDWSRVSLDALRDHLLDMDAVMKGPAPERRVIDGGIEFSITTVEQAGEAAARMVPAHAPVLAAETGWTSDVVVSDGALTWRVVAQSADEATRIQALGFFGLLATGAHHEAHHLAIARGEQMH